jgi:hypothetical protein
VTDGSEYAQAMKFLVPPYCGVIILATSFRLSDLVYILKSGGESPRDFNQIVVSFSE